MNEGQFETPKELDDSDLRQVFSAWLNQALAAAPDSARVRAIENEIGKVDAIAERLRAQALVDLARLEKRADGDATSRSVLVADFADRNDKLWKQRIVLAREAARVVERQQMKTHGPVGQQRPALEQFHGHRVVDASDLFSQMRQEAQSLRRVEEVRHDADRDQERE